MRITFVLPFAGLQGGIRVIAIYAEHLRRRGHQVAVISAPEVTRTRSKVKSLLLGRGWPTTRSRPSHFDGTGVQHRVLEEDRPVVDEDVPDSDVVVATFYKTANGVLRLSPAKGAKALFIQGYEVEEGKSNPEIDATWRLPMHKIVVSRWLGQLAKDRFGDARVSYVPNAVDLAQFNAPPRAKQDRPTVGFLYSRSSFKNCRGCLTALNKVSTALPSLRIICFGAEKPGLDLRLPSSAEFHYRPPQDSLRELYACCDVWMCGSTREGFYLPMLEAMACRCPVVSTRVGGPLEVIDEGVNGHLVDVGDMDALADRVSSVLRSTPADWQQMSEAAHRTATRLTWDDATDRFEEALELAVQRNMRGELRAAPASEV